MGYSTQIHRSLKEVPKTSNYLLVPRSSLHEKEISDQDWLHICENIRNKVPSCILYIAFDNPQWEDEEFKYYPLYSLLKSHGFHVNIFKRELGELPNTLRELSPKVISVDTWLGHITSYLWLETIMLFKWGNSKFWAFPTPNVRMVNSKLSEFLIENEYGFFDPYFWNSEIDETTRHLALQSGISLEKVIEKI